MSNWNILGSTQKISLGELQQDTGVGGVLDDGHGMSFDNNAQNSPDQSAALKHWVEAFAHEMMQHGDLDSAIAGLAAQGCPEPEAVAMLWQHQQENPETTEDLTETVPAEDPSMTPAPQELGQGAQQPLASTKTATSVAEFQRHLENGVSPEKLYAGHDRRLHPLIEEAENRHNQAQQAQPVTPGGYDPEALNQEVRDTVSDLRGTVAAYPGEILPGQGGDVMPDPNRGAEMNPMNAQPDPRANCLAMIEEMRNAGFENEAEQWLDTFAHFHPEDMGMLEGEIEDALTELGAQGEDPGSMENPFPQDMESAGFDDLGEGGMHQAKTADLAGKGPKRDKANEIYKAIRRDHPEDDKSSAAAMANASANKLAEKGDLALGNDDDKKDDDDKKGNPFAKKDDGDDKGSDKSDSDKDDKKDDDDGKPPWLKDKKSAVGSRASYQGIDGTVTAVVEDFWANKRMAYLATEHGELSVPVESLEAPTGEVVAENPIQEINDFLQIIDPAGVMPSTIEARIHNLSQVSAAARKLIIEAKVSLADQMALDEIRLNTNAEIQELQQTMEQIGTEENQAYLDAQPQYEMHAVEQADFGHQDEGGWIDGAYHDMMADAQATDFDAVVNEEPALLVNDMSDGVLQDQDAAQSIALSHISNKTYALPQKIREEINTAFLASVEKVRLQALAHRKSLKTKTASAKLDNDGPAESLFI